MNKIVIKLLAILLMFNVFNYSYGQVSVPSNTVTSDSYVGTANDFNLIFKSKGVYAGTISTQNTFLGINTGTTNYNTGLYASNAAFGANALKNYSPAYSIKNNCAFGANSLRNNLGYGNSAFGFEALVKNTFGNYNVGIGFRTLENSQTGNNNIAIGSQSLNLIDGGSNNIAIGYDSGSNLIGGNNNVFLGKVILPNSSSFSDRVIIANGIGNQRIYINGNGYTGIGLGDDIIPQNMLEVRSAANNTSGLRFTRLSSAFNPNASATRFLTVDGNGDVILRNLPLSAGAEDTSIYSHDGTLQENRTVLMDNKRLMFNTANDGRIYIGNTTNVTDNDNFPTYTGNYRLYVEGGILTEKVKVALRITDNWKDHVFADDYQLKSLKEVEAFVKENKHLPDIESAQELVENGLDLGEMQAKQMGKIEELTLYIIEQDKKLEQQSKDIEELKALVKVLLEKK